MLFLSLGFIAGVLIGSIILIAMEKRNNNIKEGTPSASYNIDYTAALEEELRDLRFHGYIDINEQMFNIAASRLNSVVEKQQNCV